MARSECEWHSFLMLKYIICERLGEYYGKVAKSFISTKFTIR